MLIVIEELNNWSKSYYNELKPSLTKEVQWIAFTLVKSSKVTNVVKLFNETFRLYEQSDMFLQNINEMLSRKEYKEVCSSLNLDILIYGSNQYFFNVGMSVGYMFELECKYYICGFCPSAYSSRQTRLG